MICDLCKTVFIVLGGVRECRCDCGKTHLICRSCRDYLLANKLGRYIEDDLGYLSGPDGFLIEMCPIALRVAQAMMRESKPDAIPWRTKRLSMEAKIEIVEKIVMEYYIETGGGLFLDGIAKRLEWHTSKVRSVINKSKLIGFTEKYGTRRHIYTPLKSTMREHIKGLRKALLEREGESS